MIERIDLFVTVLGICYGAVLIWAAFAHNALTEALRIDALFMPRPTAATRPLNLVAGIVVAGYCLHSLLGG